MIKLLEKNIADKIAAGEVIDRPVSIVKELLENSIDAGSKSISVEIERGGKSLIRVSDDGCGIAHDEVGLAFARHATSKIESDRDLDAISTLGFRGEALASIAAVCRVELLTKTKEERSGTRLTIEGGKILSTESVGCPNGSSVIVRDLFFNVPARLKFLKSDAAEASAVIELVSKIALGYPGIKIRLINNGTMLFGTRGNESLYQNILTIYDRGLADALVPLDFREGELSVSGYISKVSESRKNRKNQFFFVNGRLVESRVLGNAVSEAYSDRLFEGRFPLIYLFLELPPEKTDVNIHPSKKDIRFDEPLKVQDFVRRALREALAAKESIPTISYRSEERLPERGRALAAESEAPVRAERGEYAHNDRDEYAHNGGAAGEQIDIKKYELKNLLGNIRLGEEAELGMEPPAQGRERIDFSSLSVMGSIFATYIAAYDEDAFYLVDQHAAHERVFFEKLLAESEASDKARQLLLSGLVVDTGFSLANKATELLDTLRGFGFEAEEFGGRSLIVKAVPAFMSLSEAEDFINFFIENYDTRTNFHDEGSLRRLAGRACKAAVKGNDRLDVSEMKALFNELSKCENPYSCPHGRPTFIRLTKRDIERNFKRV